MKYHLKPVRMAVTKKKIPNVGEVMEEKEPSCNVNGNENWFSQIHREQYGDSSRN